MPDRKGSASSDNSQQGANSAGSSRSEEISDRVRALHRDYASAVQELMALAQQQASQAQLDVVRALHEAQLTAQKAQESAYATYIADLQAASKQDPGRPHLAEIQQRYVRALEGAQVQACQALEEAQRATLRALQGASEEASRAWDEARGAYVRGVRDQLVELDPQRVKPGVIALIGHGLLAAAQYSRPAQRG